MMIKVAVIIAVMFVLYIGVDTIIGLTQEINAASAYIETGYIEMQATAYCINGTTATGTQTRSGICAGKREWFGKNAVVYSDDGGKIGNLIGIYKVEDTGGKAIRNGQVLDIWIPTREECLQFGRQKVHVYIMD